MNMYEEIFTSLGEANINYLIVGGVAVNLYGYSRFTGDIDIILSLDSRNLEKFDNLMHKLGYVERQPVKVKDLGDKRILEEYVEKKGLKGFTFVSGARPQLDIDIIISESRNFEKFNAKRTNIKIWNIELPVCHIDDLIEMKQAVNREKDLIDLEALLKLKEL